MWKESWVWDQQTRPQSVALLITRRTLGHRPSLNLSLPL